MWFDVVRVRARVRGLADRGEGVWCGVCVGLERGMSMESALTNIGLVLTKKARVKCST